MDIINETEIRKKGFRLGLLVYLLLAALLLGLEWAVGHLLGVISIVIYVAIFSLFVVIGKVEDMYYDHESKRVCGQAGHIYELEIESNSNTPYLWCKRCNHTTTDLTDPN